MTEQEIRDNKPDGATHCVSFKIFNINGPVYEQCIFYKIKKGYSCIYKKGAWYILREKKFPFHESLKPLP